jgi:hypothetical protein
VYIVNKKQIGKWESDTSHTYRFTRCKILLKKCSAAIFPQNPSTWKENRSKHANIHLVPYCSFLFLSNQIYVYMIETMSFLAVTTYETMTSHSERRQVIPLKHKGMGIFRSLIFLWFWLDQGSNTRSTTLEASNLTITSSMRSNITKKWPCSKSK